MTIISDEKVCQRGEADVLPLHIVALIRERQRRLAAIPRCDRYIGRAAGHLTLQGFWRNLKRQDVEDAQRLKNWIDREIADGDRTSMSQKEPVIPYGSLVFPGGSGNPPTTFSYRSGGKSQSSRRRFCTAVKGDNSA